MQCPYFEVINGCRHGTQSVTYEAHHCGGRPFDNLTPSPTRMIPDYNPNLIVPGNSTRSDPAVGARMSNGRAVGRSAAQRKPARMSSMRRQTKVGALAGVLIMTPDGLVAWVISGRPLTGHLALMRTDTGRQANNGGE